MSQDETMRARVEEATGRTLKEWMGLLREAGLEKHGQMVALLKEQGVTHGYANTIVHWFRDEASSGAASGGADADLVAAQYSGKESLRPLYDQIVAEVGKFGPDVEVAPKKTYVSLRRSKQFALLQPSTRSRLDVGIKLDGVEPSGRLESSGSFNQMVSHRVRVTDAAQVDAQLLGWLEEAYRQA